MFAPVKLKQEINLLDNGSSGCRYVQTQELSRYPHIVELASITPKLINEVSQTGWFDNDAAIAALDLFRFAGATASQNAVNLAIGTEVFRIADPDEVEYFVSEAKRIFSTASPYGRSIEFTPITGIQEATWAAKGVIYSFPRAHALVVHIGGGSVDISYIKDGAVLFSHSLPMGADKLNKQFNGNYDNAMKFINEQIAAVPWIDDIAGQNIDLYLEGGNCRAIGRKFIKDTDYPIDIIHGLIINPSDKASQDFLSSLSSTFHMRTWKGSTKQITKRKHTLPYTGLVIEAFRQAVSSNRVIFSETGVREGRLYDLMPKEMREQSPLLVSCPYDPVLSERAVRLERWIENFIPTGSVRPEVLKATCLLSNCGASAAKHNKDTAAYEFVMRHNFGDCAPEERAFMALAVYARSCGEIKDHEVSKALDLLSDDQTRTALLAGQAIGLAYLLGNVPPQLAEAKVERNADGVRIFLPKNTPFLETPELATFVREMEIIMGLNITWMNTPERQPFSPPQRAQAAHA